MEETLLKLYKVKWKNTANTYVVAHANRDINRIIYAVRRLDERNDDIVGLEEVRLPTFDGDGTSSTEYVYMFHDLFIL